MSRVLLLLPALALIACQRDEDKSGDDTAGDSGEEAWRPDLVCPGDEGCETADGPLSVGASALSITPTCWEAWEDLDGNGEYDLTEESYYDCGCDQLCEGDEGWPGADEGEGDGTFQAIWLAGFQNARPMNGVHDDLWARTVVFRQGETTISVTSLDLVGFFNDQVDLVREAVVAAGLDVDHVIISSTHVHEGPDTMGMWGRTPFQSGIDPDYMAYVHSQTVVSIQEAIADLRPATMRIGQGDTSATSAEKGTRNVVRDSRDPVIVDEDLYAAAFTDAEGETIATLVSWGNHPEALSDENTQITSDFVHYVRESVEEGIDYERYDVAGKGGVCVYLNASVGGLMTPLGIEVTDGDGNSFSESSFEKAEALGRVIGEVALTALSEGEEVSDPSLALRMLRFKLPIDNFGFQALALAGVFDRVTYDWDETEDITEENKPWVRSEVDLLTVGPVAMLTVPGELFPELAIGGYDGSRVNTTQDEFIASDNPNPPDITLAPAGPYYKDLMGGQQNWILGLGNDEVGYIVPTYDYVLDEASPYLDEPEGDHYEETNSLGPETEARITEAVHTLLAWEP